MGFFSLAFGFGFGGFVCLVGFFFNFLFIPHWKLKEIKPEVKLLLTNEKQNILSPDSCSWIKGSVWAACESSLLGLEDYRSADLGMPLAMKCSSPTLQFPLAATLTNKREKSYLILARSTTGSFPAGAEMLQNSPVQHFCMCIHLLSEAQGTQVLVTAPNYQTAESTGRAGVSSYCKMLCLVVKWSVWHPQEKQKGEEERQPLLTVGLSWSLDHRTRQTRWLEMLNLQWECWHEINWPFASVSSPWALHKTLQVKIRLFGPRHLCGERTVNLSWKVKRCKAQSAFLLCIIPIGALGLVQLPTLCKISWG